MALSPVPVSITLQLLVKRMLSFSKNLFFGLYPHDMSEFMLPKLVLKKRVDDLNSDV